MEGGRQSAGGNWGERLKEGRQIQDAGDEGVHEGLSAVTARGFRSQSRRSRHPTPVNTAGVNASEGTTGTAFRGIALGLRYSRLLGESLENKKETTTRTAEQSDRLL